MGRWTLDDIPWRRFDAAKLDPGLVRIVKAASLVEANGAVYARHLCRVFEADPDFQTAARRWGAEEVQHGRALGRWAALADPEFDFAEALRRFPGRLPDRFRQLAVAPRLACGRDGRALHGRDRHQHLLQGVERGSRRAGAAADLPPDRRRRGAPLQALSPAISGAASSASGLASGTACGSPPARIAEIGDDEPPLPTTPPTSRAFPTTAGAAPAPMPVAHLHPLPRPPCDTGRGADLQNLGPRPKGPARAHDEPLCLGHHAAPCGAARCDGRLNRAQRTRSYFWIARKLSGRGLPGKRPGHKVQHTSPT